MTVLAAGILMRFGRSSRKTSLDTSIASPRGPRAFLKNRRPFHTMPLGHPHMQMALDALPSLAWGTLLLRPYVFLFLAVFLAVGSRDLGGGRALGFLVWGFAAAFAAEWSSTRTGVPFGLYHYTGETRGVELFLSNVPFFDSLSFPFLAYAAFCLARWTLGSSGPTGVVALSGVLMM